MKVKSAFSQKLGFEKEFEKLINQTDNPDKLKYFINPFLLPNNCRN